MKSVHSEAYQLLLRLLLEERERSSVTQAEMAIRLGKPQSFVSKYERGERRLDVIEFLEVCRYLGTDPHKLLRRIEKGQAVQGL